MKLLESLLALTLLPLSASGAERDILTDTFSSFHQKAHSSTPIQLVDSTFSRFTSVPRNHTSAVLLTALETRFGCQLCKEFQPEWDLLAKSWLRGDKEGDSKLLFGTLDFVDGRQTFQSMMLQTAPVLLLYQPTVGENAKPDAQPLRFDFSMGPQTADTIRDWLARHLPEDAPKPTVYRPFNYVRFITLTTILLGIITFGTVSWPYVSPVLYNRNLWAVVSLLAILLFTSGHMFNHIRSVPYVSSDGKGGIVYFAPGFQGQLGLESQIVAALYGILAFATISLAVKVPRISSEKSQQVAVIIWVAVMFCTYSFLLSVFRAKNSGYPFWLPPF